MANVKVDGSLEVGPPGAGESFPGMEATAPLSLIAGTLGVQRATGVMPRTLTDSANFVNIGEPGNAVTKALILYWKSNAPVELRLTFEGGSPQVVPLKGLVIMELDPANPLTLLEAKGSGQVEYLLAGNE